MSIGAPISLTLKVGQFDEDDILVALNPARHLTQKAQLSLKMTLIRIEFPLPLKQRHRNSAIAP